MLSIGIVGSAMDIQKYFIDKDNYYLTDKSEIAESAKFYGKGAELLGINNKQIEETAFLNLLKGELPNGEQIGKLGESIKHRPATDITLSAPKSFSVMALVADDKRLIDVHNQAVEKTLNKIELLYAEARKTVNGVTSYEKTGNLTVSMFRHTSSREKDPQLHTHNVILNMTMRDDGAWRALSSRQRTDLVNIENGFRENIYANQHYLGMIYNSEIAKGAIECGYEIEVLDEYGNFKFKGLSNEYLESQSKRRNQIINRANELGVTSAKALSYITKDTRIKKDDISPEALKKTWIQEAKDQNINLNSVYQKSLDRVANKDNTSQASLESNVPQVSKGAKSAINDAISHLSQFSVELKHSDIIRQAFIFGGASITHEALESVIMLKQEKGELIGKSDQSYTTKALLNQEKSFKEEALQSKGVSWSKDIDQSGLIAESLKNNDRIQIIDIKGLKNEVKLIDQAVKTAEANQLNVFVLHPSQQILNRLESGVKREQSSFWQLVKNTFKHDLLQTTNHFEHYYESRLNHPFKSKKEDYVIVTDAQKLSYAQISRLNELAEKGNAKLVLLNNTESTQGFSVGNPMKVLKEAEVSSFQSRTEKSNVLIDIKESSFPNESLAKHYATLDRDERINIPLVTITNKAKDEITSEIRKSLKELGQLSIQEINYQVLSSKSLTDTEKKYLKSYAEGDQIIFNPFTKGQIRYVISSINKDDQTFKLINTKGITKELSLTSLLKEDFHINKMHSLPVSVNEQLRVINDLYINHKSNILSNEKHIKIEKGHIINVKSISDTGLRIEYQNKNLWLSNDQLKTVLIDHGYVIKPHQLHKDVNHIMTSISGYQVSKNTIGDLKEYAQTVTLFTDNKEKATKSLDDKKINWVASDIIAQKYTYNPIIRTDKAIEKDAKSIVSQLINEYQNNTNRQNHRTERNDLEIVSNALMSPNKTLTNDQIAQTAVAYSIAKLSEREATFTLAEISQEALKYAFGKTNLEEIENAIENKKINGELLINESHVTTKTVYDLEKAIISNVQNEQGKVIPIVKNLPSLPEYLTQGQKDAVSLALTTQDRFIGVQGLAGTGKTTMMNELKKQAESHGYQLVGIAPTHKSVRVLDQSINEHNHQDSRLIRAEIPVMTAHQFINDNLNQYNDKTIFIIDESSMIGNRIYHDIQEKTKSINARTIFTGDIKQQVAIENGKPQELSMLNGMKYAQMNEIVRQNANPLLKKSAELAANDKAGASIKNLENIDPFSYIKRKSYYSGAAESFIEIANDTKEKDVKHDAIFSAISNDYLTRIPEQRDNTIIVASTHKSRSQIDELIRAGLKEEGLINHEKPVERLIAKNLTQAEMLHVKNYKDGEFIRFNQSFSIAKKGDVMQVIGIDKENNKLKLYNQSDNNTYTINPAKIALKSQMTTYQSISSNLGEGDRIRLRITDKTKKWKGSEEYHVKEIKDDIAIITNENGMLKLNINDKKDQIWDYAYTNTTYSVQGETSKLFIGLELIDNNRSNYIQITRASEHAVIYTDNKAKLIARLDDEKIKYEASKRSAYEAFHKEKYHTNTQNKQPQEPHIQTKKSIHKNSINKIVKTNLSDEIKPLLNQRMEELASTLLGEPNQKLSSSSQLRYGKNGSLTININQSTWYSHETGEGGNALDLIKYQMGFTDFKDVLNYAKSFLNYEEIDKNYEKKVQKRPVKIDLESQKKQDKMKRYAESLYKKSKPLSGTLGEKYLIESRKLTNFSNADIRFLSSIQSYDKDTNKRIYSPAIIAFSKDNNDKLHHLQVIRIDKNGNKNASVKIAKQTYGAMNGFSVELNNKSNKEVTYLSEGIETGLSILNAEKRAHVLAVLGKSNFANIELNKIADKVILALDNDGFNKTFSDRTILNAIDRFEKNGKEVQIIIPKDAKTDFNDVLKNKGEKELIKQINTFISPEVFKKIHNKINEKSLDISNKSDIEGALKILNKEGVKLDQFSNEIVNNFSFRDQEKSLEKSINSFLNEQRKTDQIENISPENKNHFNDKVNKEMER